MDDNEKLSWSALEYEEKERSRDWFWALGIIVATSSIASIIYGNFFFAIFVVLGGVLLGFFAIKKPDVISYELNAKGLKIRNRLYPYENIKSFWVQVGASGETSVKPILSMPIDETMAEEIHSVMLSNNVEEKEMKEHPSEKIMEVLGF